MWKSGKEIGSTVLLECCLWYIQYMLLATECVLFIPWEFIISGRVMSLRLWHGILTADDMKLGIGISGKNYACMSVIKSWPMHLFIKHCTVY